MHLWLKVIVYLSCNCVEKYGAIIIKESTLQSLNSQSIKFSIYFITSLVTIVVLLFRL